MNNEVGLRRSTQRSYRVRDRWIAPKLVGTKPLANGDGLVFIYDTAAGRLEEVKATCSASSSGPIWEVEASSTDEKMRLRLEQLVRNQLAEAHAHALIAHVENARQVRDAR